MGNIFAIGEWIGKIAIIVLAIVVLQWKGDVQSWELKKQAGFLAFWLHFCMGTLLGISEQVLRVTDVRSFTHLDNATSLAIIFIATSVWAVYREQAINKKSMSE